MGVKVDSLEIEETEIMDFCITMSIRNRVTKYRFIVITVYGPAHHEFFRDFLEELDRVCVKGTLPTVIGGYFNLIRETQDKNSENCDTRLMEMFNNFIGRNHLWELARAGPR